MKTKALFFFVCLCALTLGFDAQAKVGDIVWQKPDNISWGEYDPYDGTFYEYDVDNNTIVAHRKDDFSRLWESGNLGRGFIEDGGWGVFETVYNLPNYFSDAPYISASKDAIYLASRRNTFLNPAVIQKRSKKNGALIWEKEVKSQKNRLISDWCDVHIVDGFSATTRGLYLSYTSSNGCYGQKEIKYPIYGASGVYKIDVDTGEKIWRNYDYYKLNQYMTSIAVYDGEDHDYVYDYGAYVDGLGGKRNEAPMRRLDENTGEQIWKSQTDINEGFAAFDKIGVQFDKNGNLYTHSMDISFFAKSGIIKVNAENGKIDAAPRYFGPINGVELFFYGGDLYGLLETNMGGTILFSLDGEDLSENWIKRYDSNVSHYPNHVSGKLADDDYYVLYSTKWYSKIVHGGMYVDDSGIYTLDSRHFVEKEVGAFGVSNNPKKICIRDEDCVKNAQYVSHTYSLDNGVNWTSGFPVKLDLGQDFSVSMVMKNTGNVPWYKSIDMIGRWNSVGKNLYGVEQPLIEEPIMLRSEKYNLGPDKLYFSTEYPKKYSSIENLSTTFLGSQMKSIGPWRSLITDIPFDNPVVDSGETVTFTQNFTAPKTPGCYEFESWQMSVDNTASFEPLEWFGDKTPKGIICVSTEPPCTPDYRCTSIPTSEKCDNTNCDKTITTKRSICYDREKCSGGDGVVSKEVCQEKNKPCPNDVTEVCSCPKTSKGIFREVAP